MTRRVRVANAGLKVVVFLTGCRWLVRVAGKGVRGAVASDECLVARPEGENPWKERGGLICERNIRNGSRVLADCQLICECTE